MSRDSQLDQRSLEQAIKRQAINEMPKVQMKRANTNEKPYDAYVPKKKKMSEPVPAPAPAPVLDIWAQYRQMLAEDPVHQAMMAGTMSWADTLDPEPVPTEEEIAEYRRAQQEHLKRQEREQMLARLEKAKDNYDLVVRQLNRRPIAHQLAQERLDDYYEAKEAWLLTNEEYLESDPDTLGMGWESDWEEKYDEWFKHETKDIHRDANGEPEVCRYFNSPGGCRLADGKKCPYKHVAGAAPEACRFFGTPRGCNKGSSCPFAHPTTATTASSWRQASASASATASGSFTSFASFGAAAGGGGDASSVASGGSWTSVKPRQAAPSAEFCRFFKSARGCNKGSSCPYKH